MIRYKNIARCIIILLGIYIVEEMPNECLGWEIIKWRGRRSETTCFFSWRTPDIDKILSVSTKGALEYGETEALGKMVESGEYKEEHSIRLEGLTPNTKYYYRIRAEDMEGNIVVTEIDTFWIDITAPEIEIISPVDGAVVNGIIEIKCRAWDNIGVQKVRLWILSPGIDIIEMEVNREPYTFVWDTGSVKDGKYEIRATAVDLAGGGNGKQIKITVDNILPIPPKVRIISPIDGQIVSGVVKIIAEVTDDDEIFIVDYFVNDEEEGYSEWPPYEDIWKTGGSFYPPGIYTIKAKARDIEGNIGESQSIKVRVVAPGTDITPPVTQDNYQFNNTWTNQDASITLTATDDITGVKETHYTIDGTEQIGTNIRIIQEGIHTIQYWSIDNIGNIESKHTIIVKIDKTLPTLIIYTDSAGDIWPPDNKTVTVTVRGSAEDQLSGVSSKAFTVTDEYNEISPTLSDFNQGIELIAARRGDDLDGRVYTIKVDVTDNTGNSASGQTTVIVLHDKRK